MDATMTPMPAGESGETFLADAGGVRSVVRVYGAASASRGPEAPLVDAAVLRLVRGPVPVPEVLEVRTPVPGAPGLLVTGELPGTPGAHVLDTLAGSEHVLRAAGEHMGGAAARIAGVPMLRRGVFADGNLRLVDFPDGTAPGEVVAAVTSAYERGALSDWPSARLRSLGRLAGRAQRLLEGAEDHLGGAACLSHGDLTPANVLLDAATGDLTGVVDWEAAHAGVPWSDLGALLRQTEGPVAGAYAEGVLTSWRGTVRLVDPPGATELLDLARAADLAALVGLADPASPAGRTALRLLESMAGTEDLHASPPARPR
ncbi:phosphotransferase [Nocardioidaceae bacterium]|nr:phosphotransferase [Nocardioidaceae bacterium]